MQFIFDSLLNEWLFLAHVVLAAFFSLLALRLGSFALAALISLEAVLANLFVVKQMVLFGLQVTCSDVYAVGSLLSLSLLQEYYGKQEAKKAAHAAFLCMVFFALMSQVHLLYRPSSFDDTHGAFDAIFTSSPRIFFASIASYYLVQQLDMRVFAWLRMRLEGGHLALRFFMSLGLAQIIDTCLFSFLGLYGIVSSMFDLILVSLCVKWVTIACLAPFTVFSRRFARVNV